MRKHRGGGAWTQRAKATLLGQGGGTDEGLAEVEGRPEIFVYDRDSSSKKNKKVDVAGLIAPFIWAGAGTVRVHSVHAGSGTEYYLHLSRLSQAPASQWRPLHASVDLA